MMQSINFYFEEYRPKPLTFDSRFAAVTLAVVLVAMVIYGVLTSQHISKQQDYQQAQQNRLENLQQQVAEMEQNLSASGPVDSLDNQILRQQQALNNYRKLLAKMAQPEQTKALKYSYIMQQLGEQQAKSVWLTNIKLSGANLSLKGVSTDSEAIPSYVSALGQADSLKRYFDELQVERDTENSRLVNFSLVNGRLAQ